MIVDVDIGGADLGCPSERDTGASEQLMDQETDATTRLGPVTIMSEDRVIPIEG